MEQLMAHAGAAKMSRADLVTIPVPEATESFKPIPHVHVVNSLVEALGYRHISVVNDEYAVSEDGMKFFGVLEIETQFTGCRFMLAVRNANDKSMRLALTVGFRVFCCDNMAFHGDFTPVLHKHTKNFNLEDSLAIGIDRMQRNFEPMRKQVETWRDTRITDDFARLTIYRAFVEEALDVPKHLGKYVHLNWFDPQYDEFVPRTRWSLNNAFTSAFKVLNPVSRFKATAEFAKFFNE